MVKVMDKTTKMKIGFWEGKMKANPKIRDIAEEEIAKLKLEAMKDNKNYNRVKDL